MGRTTYEMNEFCIVIPTINRIDLLIPSLLMYVTDMPNVDIFIYDNGNQFIKERLQQLRQVRGMWNQYKGIKNIEVFGGTGENIGVAGAWNFLCNKAFEHYRHVLVLNDDVYLHTNEYDLNGLVAYMNGNKVDFFGCEPKYDWSAFMISKRCFDVVGQFDDNFMPAYFEDNDYMYRMSLLLGKMILKFDFIPTLNPTIFRRSSSIMKSDSLLESINAVKVKNFEYYKLKWGGGIGHETYRYPFGEK